MREQVGELAAQGHRLVFYEASLLVEAGRASDFDALVVVTASEEQQLLRTMGRDGSSRDHALARLRAQLPLADKRQLATHLIDNSGDLARHRGAGAGAAGRATTLDRRSDPRAEAASAAQPPSRATPPMGVTAPSQQLTGEHQRIERAREDHHPGHEQPRHRPGPAHPRPERRHPQQRQGVHQVIEHARSSRSPASPAPPGPAARGRRTPPARRP